MNKYDKSLVDAAKKINADFRKGDYDPLPLDYAADEHIPMNTDDYMYLYDILEGLNYEFYREFPMLADVKRICMEHIEARCLGGE